jgi:hypothetical protein
MLHKDGDSQLWLQLTPSTLITEIRFHDSIHVPEYENVNGIKGSSEYSKRSYVPPETIVNKYKSLRS